MTKLKFVLLFLAIALLATSVNAADTMGLYQTKIGSANSSFIDTIAWSYTRPNYFNIEIGFGKKDIKKTNKGITGAHQFFLELTRFQYEKIFENRVPVNNLPINDNMWDRKISTVITPVKRIITISFTNAIDAEIPNVFKRGKIEIVIRKNYIASLKMIKEKKRFLFGGFKKFFYADARNLKLAKKGLALRDEGEMGRVLKEKNIDKALANKTGKGFSSAIKADK